MEYDSCPTVSKRKFRDTYPTPGYPPLKRERSNHTDCSGRVWVAYKIIRKEIELTNKNYLQ